MVSMTKYWMVSVGFGLSGLGLVAAGMVLLVVCYQREERVMVWNELPDAMNAKCEECGTVAHIFNPEHEAGARCVICGGTIKILADDEKTELEVDDVFGKDRETVDCDAPAGSCD
jgi:ribosomal protein S27E